MIEEKVNDLQQLMKEIFEVGHMAVEPKIERKVNKLVSRAAKEAKRGRCATSIACMTKDAGFIKEQAERLGFHCKVRTSLVFDMFSVVYVWGWSKTVFTHPWIYGYDQEVS